MRMQFVMRLAVFFFSGFVFSQNTPLLFGNPSGALADSACSGNYLIEKKQYTLSYNARLLIPNWVSWHLDSGDLGAQGRGNDFRPDDTLPESFYSVKKGDYQYKKYGFDRGHVCPSADRTASREDNSATFLMTNMIPQAPDCNRILWKNLEAFERNLAESGKELYIIAGPQGTGGTSAAGYFETIVISDGTDGSSEELFLNVPAFCWKIILVLDDGENDRERVTEETDVIAVYMPNAQRDGTTVFWYDYLTTVDFIEEKTGYDFFSALSEPVETVLEAKRYCFER